MELLITFNWTIIVTSLRNLHFLKSGKEYQNTIGHFSNLGNCLEAIARDDAKSVKL